MDLGAVPARRMDGWRGAKLLLLLLHERELNIKFPSPIPENGSNSIALCPSKNFIPLLARGLPACLPACPMQLNTAPRPPA